VPAAAISILAVQVPFPILPATAPTKAESPRRARLRSAGRARTTSGELRWRLPKPAFRRGVRDDARSSANPPRISGAPLGTPGSRSFKAFATIRGLEWGVDDGRCETGDLWYRGKRDVARGLSVERFAVHGYGCIESRGGAVFLSAPSNSAGRHRQGGGTELRYTADLWCSFSIRASLSRGSSGSRSRTFVVRR
jgi:hypothetical protein